MKIEKQWITKKSRMYMDIARKNEKERREKVEERNEYGT